MVKRVIAFTGIGILAGMYIATFVCALLATPATKQMFMGSLILTVVIPIITWFFLMMYQKAHQNDDKNISMSEMRNYKKRMKNGESPEQIAKEIEEKYNIKEETKEN